VSPARLPWSGSLRDSSIFMTQAPHPVWEKHGSELQGRGTYGELVRIWDKKGGAHLLGQAPQLAWNEWAATPALRPSNWAQLAPQLARPIPSGCNLGKDRNYMDPLLR